MRLVIVEDEPKTRAGLIHIISQKTDYEIVGSAENGEEGLAKIKELQPDLVISDICMTKMNGLDMLQKMRDEGIEAQVILLTGYSEFEYARRALQLQVVEYVLKPLEVDKFLMTLQEMEVRIRKYKNEKITPEQQLWSYLSASEEIAGELCPDLEERLRINEKSQITLFLIRPGSMARETMQEMMRLTGELMEMLCIEPYYIFRISEERGFFLMITDTKRQPRLPAIFESRVAVRLSELSESIYGMVKINGMRELKDGMRRVSELMTGCFSLPENSLLDEERAALTQTKSLEYPDFLEQSVIRAIRSGNREKILEKGESFISTVVNSEASPDCIKEYTIRFAAALLRVISEIRGSYEKAHEITYIMNGITKSQTNREVAYQLNKIISSAANTEQNFIITENGMVMNAVTFVRENYNQEITLAEAARCCGVTQEYLSKVFAREVGVGFNSFLQNYRVSMAKRMLLSGGSKIGEVAEAVGYRDQKYFTKVFKKLSGVTPAEYKRENGQ